MTTIKFTDPPDAAQQTFLAELPAAEQFALMETLHALEKPLELFDNCIEMGIQNLNSAMDVFWELEDSRLLQVLNYYGPAKVQAIFTAHESRAKQLDAIRKQRGLPPLAKIGAQRAVTVNPQTGKFEFVPPVVEPTEE